MAAAASVDIKNRPRHLRDPKLCLSHTLLCLFAALGLLLLAGPARRRVPRLLLMHDELRVALLAIPLEAREVGVLELVVCLHTPRTTTSALAHQTMER